MFLKHLTRSVRYVLNTKHGFICSNYWCVYMYWFYWVYVQYICGLYHLFNL